MEFELNHNSGIPLHLQVEQILRHLIDLPEYRSGRLLPNEEALSKRLGISRNTVRQAANKLVYEGLIVRKKGVGTRVIDQAVSTRLDNWLSFTQEMNSKGIPFRNYEIAVGWVEADDELATTLMVKPGQKILKLERLRGMETGPIVFFISYFHPRIGLIGDEDFSTHLYNLLEQKYSTVVNLSKEEIRAQKADDVLAKKLNIAIGDPILFRKRRVYDPGNRIIEYNLGYYRADSFTYSIDIERDRK
ncbi:MAG: GntR family transcriptional regulator [Candidatus Marinimicrobia bacterium]|nr:GntR family transcriptional regulator [Candidatus Neomarinimicrobiota bacterium]